MCQKWNHSSSIVIPNGVMGVMMMMMMSRNTFPFFLVEILFHRRIPWKIFVFSSSDPKIIIPFPNDYCGQLNLGSFDSIVVLSFLFRFSLFCLWSKSRSSSIHNTNRKKTQFIFVWILFLFQNETRTFQISHHQQGKKSFQIVAHKQERRKEIINFVKF